MKPIELKDFLNYRFLSGLRYAPDHSKAAFAVSVANEEDNSYTSCLWLYENRKTRQLTSLGKEKSFWWMDSDRLVFPAVRTEAEKKQAETGIPQTNLYCLDLRGGEALPWLTLPFPVGGIKVLDENHFAVSAAIDSDHPDDYKAPEDERKELAEKKKKDKDYEVLTEIPFWMNGEGFTNRQRGALFLVTVSPFSVTRITGPTEDVGALTVLGNELIYNSQAWQGKMPLLGCHVQAYDWSSGATRTIFRDDELAVSDLQALDGRLLMTATDGVRHGCNENDWVYLADATTGERSLIRQEEYNMYNSTGSDCRLGGGQARAVCGGSLYHTATREGNCGVLRLLSDGTSEPVLTRDGSVDCFDIDPATGHLLLIGLFDMKLQELYEYAPETDSLTQITHFNDEILADKYVAQPQPVTVGSAGLIIGGWVLYPRDYVPGKKYPAVLDIHGGPKTVYGPIFYHEMQVWASQGYFVFFCNPKGSDGRDNDFMDIFGHYGETDYQNLMDFTDEVLAEFPQIDPKRVCVTGGSYGGFMTNWIIGHTGRFCCAASQRSIANWTGFRGTSDIGYFFVPDQCKADLYTGLEDMWRQSPLAYSDKAVTPTLFIHSDEDYRCPMSEGLQMFTALRANGVEARLCLFHGENHELSRSGKPQHRVRRLTEITDWFNRFSAEK